MSEEAKNSDYRPYQNWNKEAGKVEMSPQGKKEPASEHRRFFDTIERRYQQTRSELDRRAHRLRQAPEESLRFIAGLVEETATHVVFGEIRTGRDLLEGESEEEALLRVYRYAKDPFMRHAGHGMRHSSGILDEALAAEKLRAWTEVLSALRSALKGGELDALKDFELR